MMRTVHFECCGGGGADDTWRVLVYSDGTTRTLRPDPRRATDEARQARNEQRVARAMLAARTVRERLQ